MADPTNDEVVADLKRQVAEQAETIKSKDTLIGNLTNQIKTLRSGIGIAVEYPNEVKADIRERMAAGLPREIAIERALVQYEHNQKLAAAAAEPEEAEQVTQEKAADALSKSRTAQSATLGGKKTPAAKK